jgi:2-phosphosulfolactate phosphatase
MPAEPDAVEGLDTRVIERCEDIPSDPAPGNYVVVDVLHFSTTVIELFDNGAAYVHVTEERGDEFAFRERHPDALIGGDSTDEYEPVDGYDFFNSPSYAQSLDLEGSPVALTSTNGGRAVDRLRTAGDDDVSVFVGSTTNAAALGRYLRGREEPTYLVSAGSAGERATEDHIGAILVGRYLEGNPPSAIERQVMREHLKVTKGCDYIDKHEVRRADVLDYAMNLNSRQIIPRLDGDRLFDLSRTQAAHRRPRPTPA